MPDLYMIKGLDGALHATSDQDREYLNKIKAGTTIKVTVKKERNARHHRLGMAILRMVFDNQDKYTVWEHFLTEVKILTGHVETFIRAGGDVIYSVKSINFLDMDELEFAEWKNTAINVVFESFIPTMGEKERNNVINRILAAS